MQHMVHFYMFLYTALCKSFWLIRPRLIPGFWPCWRSEVVCGGLAGNSRVYSGDPAVDIRPPLGSSVLCAGDPDAALNAGHRRLLTKLGEREGFLCARLKEVHAIKNSLPSCQCVAIKNSWAGLLPAFSHVKVDSPIVPLSCHNSPFTGALCRRLCAGAITDAKSAS